MHALFLTFPKGETIQALVFARGSDFIRVGLPGQKDASELRYEGSRWLCDGVPVQVEAILSEEIADIPGFLYEERTSTAGS